MPPIVGRPLGPLTVEEVHAEVCPDSRCQAPAGEPCRGPKRGRLSRQHAGLMQVGLASVWAHTTRVDAANATVAAGYAKGVEWWWRDDVRREREARALAEACARGEMD